MELTSEVTNFLEFQHNLKSETIPLIMPIAGPFSKPKQASPDTPVEMQDKLPTPLWTPLWSSPRRLTKHPILVWTKTQLPQTSFRKQHKKLERSCWAVVSQSGQVRWIFHDSVSSSFLCCFSSKLLASFNQQNPWLYLSFFHCSLNIKKRSIFSTRDSVQAAFKTIQPINKRAGKLGNSLSDITPAWGPPAKRRLV